MSTELQTIDVVQTKLVNATSRVVPMHLQIRALKMLVRAKKKVIGPRRPPVHFVEAPVPDVNTLALEDIDTSNPFLYRQDQWRAYFKRLRDEAHRFAIGSHRARRKKEMVKNPLDEIDGIGPARKRALLHHFGTAKGVGRAALAGGRGDAHDLAPFALLDQGPNDGAATEVHPAHLHVDDALEHVGLHVDEFRLEDLCRRPAYDFLRGPAVHLLSSPIPGRRDKSLIGGDNGVVNVLEQMGLIRECLLRLPALGDFAFTNEGSPNGDWNPVWDVRTGRFEGGWTVEMEIPFKSLRYRPGRG